MLQDSFASVHYEIVLYDMVTNLLITELAYSMDQLIACRLYSFTLSSSTISVIIIVSDKLPGQKKV